MCVFTFQRSSTKFTCLWNTDVNMRGKVSSNILLSCLTFLIWFCITMCWLTVSCVNKSSCHLSTPSVSVYLSLIAVTRDGRFGSKVGQIDPKWDKSGTFSDQISVHLAQMSWSDLKKSRICPIWGQSDPLLDLILPPWCMFRKSQFL